MLFVTCCTLQQIAAVYLDVAMGHLVASIGCPQGRHLLLLLEDCTHGLSDDKGIRRMHGDTSICHTPVLDHPFWQIT